MIKVFIDVGYSTVIVNQEFLYELPYSKLITGIITNEYESKCNSFFNKSYNAESDKNIINKFEIKNSIQLATKLIKNQGRILVRKSGTESKIRIMGESENRNLLLKCVNIIVKKIK